MTQRQLSISMRRQLNDATLQSIHILDSVGVIVLHQNEGNNCYQIIETENDDFFGVGINYFNHNVISSLKLYERHMLEDHGRDSLISVFFDKILKEERLGLQDTLQILLKLNIYDISDQHII